MTIREYRDSDAAAFRQCVIAMQDFERAIDPRLRPGEAMAYQYCEDVLAHCREAEGRVFVAEDNENVVGFVAVVSREPFTQLDQPPGHYALITDLSVLEPSRGRGTGRRLIERAEAFARESGATELRIGVLADNRSAKHLYLKCKFVPYLEILTKRY